MFRLPAFFVPQQTVKVKPSATKHQAKECAFMTQELSAISHKQMVAPAKELTLLFMILCRQYSFQMVNTLQELINNPGHEY
jgi:hypothetical protein